VSAQVAFEVLGVPVPKGNMRAYTPKGWSRPIITDMTKNVKPWQASIADAARQAMAERPPLDGPVVLVVRFFMPRPKSAPKRVRHPTTKPDLDKLLRALKDGLTRAGVYRDDSQVVYVVARKEFAAGTSDPWRDAGVPRAVVELDQVVGEAVPEQLGLSEALNHACAPHGGASRQ